MDKAEYFKLCWERYKMELNQKAHIDVHSYHPSSIITASFGGLFFLVKDYSRLNSCGFESYFFWTCALVSFGFGIACGYQIYKAYVPPTYKIINSPEAYHEVFESCQQGKGCFEGKMIKMLNSATSVNINKNIERMKFIYLAKRLSIGAVLFLILAAISYLCNVFK